MVDAFRRRGIETPYEVLVDVFRDEGHEGRHEPAKCGQCQVQSLVSGDLVGACLFLPEPAAIASHVPVRQILP